MHKVPLPSTCLPVLDNPDLRQSLSGEWQCLRAPFPKTDVEMVDSLPNLTGLDLKQPGKVIYVDPEGNPDDIENWHRVRLNHIKDEDGALIYRTIECPAWEGKRLFLCFEGIYPAADIYLNGQKLGEHRHGLLPCEFEVTSLIEPGQTALLAIRLFRKHSFVEMDMPRHSLEFVGLHGDAWLHARDAFTF